MDLIRKGSGFEYRIKEIGYVADVINNTEAIMDLIASIQFIENRLGGYNSNQSKSKSMPKNIRSHAGYEKNAQTDSTLLLSEQDTQLGRNIDTLA